MKKILFLLLWLAPVLLSAQATYGNLSPIYVEGNLLRDVHGNIVRLHGVSDCPSPEANHNRWGEEANEASITRCNSYFSKLITGITKADAGARCNAFRLQLAYEWQNDLEAEEGMPAYSAFSATRLKSNITKLYWKIILAALRRGLYVVVSAPGECPDQLQAGDAYQQYLSSMWDTFTQNDSILKYSGQISLELASGLKAIDTPDGEDSSAAIRSYFAPIEKKIRDNGFGGIVWTPSVSGHSLAANGAEGPALRTIQGWTKDMDEELTGNPWMQVVLGSTDDYLDVDTLMADGTVLPARGNGSDVEMQGIKDCWATYARLSEEAPARRAYKHYWTADQGNGTFINPILNGDFPDVDIIRVDDTYYLISTTMYIFPGATIMKSRDLVNWEYCCNPLEKIDDNDAYNLLNGKEHYSQGQWATSMRYHDGQFYVYFISYGRSGVDSGRNVLLTAKNAEGPWKMQYMNEHYYDSGWMFDDGPDGDGYLYVACGIGGIFVNKLDAKTLKKISDTKVIDGRDGTEGARMYHIGKYYYIYLTTGGYWRGQTIYRSEKPMGPYTEMPNLNKYSDERGGNAFWGAGIHQGGLVQTQTGEWWTILFKDAGGIGRVPYLEPVVWQDGWPIIGNKGVEVSKGGKAYRKPDVGTTYPRTYLPTNDSFTSLTLGKQWGWNHNHVDDKWSLLERPGHLRLHTVNVTSNLRFARNSLTQRIMGLNAEGTSSTKNVNSYGTIKLDVSGMVEGDVAGLAVYQDPYQLIGITVRNGEKRIVYMTARSSSDWKPTEKLGPAIKSDVIYLRAIVNFSNDKSNLYYSLDNAKWTKFGDEMSMRFDLSIFVGNRFYIFNYATQQTGGYVDVDWFSTEPTFSEDLFYGDDVLHAYPVGEVTAISLKASKAEVNMMPGSQAPVTLTCTMQSGTEVNVTTGCTYECSTPGIVQAVAGRLMGVGEGTTEVTATYTDALGHPVSTTFTVSVSYFPLSTDAMEANMMGGTSGILRSSSEYITLKPAAKNMGGWHYDQGVDLTGKGQYLVFHLSRALSGPSKPTLRLYDTNDVNASIYYEYLDFGKDTLVVVDLSEASKVVDLSHIFYVSLYTKTSIAMQIKEVYLSNDGIHPTAILSITQDQGQPAAPRLLRTDFFTPDGRQHEGLQPGINILRRVYEGGRMETLKIKN